MIECLRALINDLDFQRTYRVYPHAFTRTRKLPFPRVLVGLLQGTKMSLQPRLNRLFKALGQCADVATASAFCQARQKLHPGAIRLLHTAAVTFFYRKGGENSLVRLWKGHRLLSTDGTRLNLPDTPELRTMYSIQRNSTSQETVQALGSCLYDLVNDVALNFEVSPVQVEKQAIFTGHAAYWQPNDIIIYDRKYADYSVVAYHAQARVEFLIRCPTRKSFKAIDTLINSNQMEMEVTLRVTRRAKAWTQAHRLPTHVQVRLVKIPLPTGETEVLMTSLRDTSRYPREALGELYWLRWGIETYFDRLKNLLDVERFSTLKHLGILQDLYSCVFLSTLSSLLIQEPAQKLQKSPRRRKQPRRYHYQINHTVAYHSVVEALVDLLLQPPLSLSKVVSDLHHLMKQQPTPIRPGRSFPRPRLKTRPQLNYLRYKKRLWT